MSSTALRENRGGNTKNETFSTSLKTKARLQSFLIGTFNLLTFAIFLASVDGGFMVWLAQVERPNITAFKGKQKTWLTVPM